MNLQVWHWCILVTTGVVLAEFAVHAWLSRKVDVVLRKRLRTAALGLLSLLTIVMLVVALGPSLADQLASVAAAVTAAVAVWLTYRSYRTQQVSDTGGTGVPEAPDGSGDPAP